MENSYGPEIIFSYQVPVTLTFDLLTPKSIGVIHDTCRICVLVFMKIGVTGKRLLSGNQFQFSMSCDLDLWPFDPKSIGVQVDGHGDSSNPT